MKTADPIRMKANKMNRPLVMNELAKPHLSAVGQDGWLQVEYMI